MSAEYITGGTTNNSDRSADRSAWEWGRQRVSPYSPNISNVKA